MPLDEAEEPFECPSCEFVHLLDDEQLYAIDRAFGRALAQAEKMGGAAPTAPSSKLRH